HGARRDLLQQLNPFAALFGDFYRKTGDVATRTRKTRAETAGDCLGNVHEHDGNCPRRAGKSAGHGSSVTGDYGGPQLAQLFGDYFDSIRISAAPAKFDPEIVAFRPP